MSLGLPTLSAFCAEVEREYHNLAKNLLDNATTKITFWGKRVVVAKPVGMFSSEEPTRLYSLNFLAKKIIDLANKRCEKDNLTTEERLLGIRISKIFDRFYEMTDKQVKQRNFLTRFFVFLREYSFRSNIRYQVDNGYIRKLFSAYSEQSYIETFGNEKTDSNKYKYELDRLNYEKSGFSRIVVSDETIKDYFARAKEFLKIS